MISGTQISSIAFIFLKLGITNQLTISMTFIKITFFRRSSEKAHHQQVLLPNLFNWRQTLHLPSRLQKTGAHWMHTQSCVFVNIK